MRILRGVKTADRFIGVRQTKYKRQGLENAANAFKPHKLHYGGAAVSLANFSLSLAYLFAYLQDPTSHSLISGGAK